MRRFDDPFSSSELYCSAHEAFLASVLDALRGTRVPRTWTQSFVNTILGAVEPHVGVDSRFHHQHRRRVLRELEHEPVPERIEDVLQVVLIARDHVELMNIWSPMRNRRMRTAADYVRRGRHRMVFESLGRALADFNRALELSPLHSDAYADRAHAFQLLDEHALSLRDYRLAVQLSDPPRRTNTRLTLSELLLETGQPAEARAEFQGHLAELEVIAARPRSPGRFALGRARYRRRWIALSDFACLVPRWRAMVQGLAAHGDTRELEEAIVRIRDSLGMWQD